MRYVIFGAGAIGGTIGGRLAEHGHDVVLVARGAHHDALRDRGLLLRTPSGPVQVQVPVTDDVSTLGLGAGDVVVVCTKSQDAEAAFDAIAAASSPEVAVVCAQNGVENERRALRRFAHVHGMAVMLPASHMEPGVVDAHGAPGLGDPRRRSLPHRRGRGRHERERRPRVVRLPVERRPAGDAAQVRQAPAQPGQRAGGRLRHARRRGGRHLPAGPGRGAGLLRGGRHRRAHRRRRRAAQGHEDGPDRRGPARRRVDVAEPRPVRARRSRPTTSTARSSCSAGCHGVPTPVNEALQRLGRRLVADHVAPGTFPLDELQAMLDSTCSAGPASPIRLSP